MNRIFHIVDRDVWAAALDVGSYAPSSLDTEGFVHFSFAHQVRAPADAIYRDVPNLFVVEIDAAQLTDEIKVEDSYGSGTEFPHVYGAIPTAALVGSYELDDDLFTGSGRATPDR